MTWIELGVIFLILLLSYDTTLFLQSLISQPIFSCALVGIILGNMATAVQIGIITQLFFLSYLPVGGAKIPDPQIGPNLIVLFEFSSATETKLSMDTLILFALIISFIFMFLTNIERNFASKYMKYIPYEKVNISSIFIFSYLLHFILFLIPILIIYHMLIKYQQQLFNVLKQNLNLEYFDEFIVIFSIGNLVYRFFNRGFKYNQ